MYRPPDSKSLTDDLQELFLDNTICTGNLKAKHFIWGSTSTNSRGNKILNMIDDAGFSIHNDGTPTYYFLVMIQRKLLIYLSLALISAMPVIGKSLRIIGSDHLPR